MYSHATEQLLAVVIVITYHCLAKLKFASLVTDNGGVILKGNMGKNKKWLPF